MTLSSTSFLCPAQRVPSSLRIEANLGFVSWKELKSALLCCTSWHGTNDFKALSRKGSPVAGVPVVSQRSGIAQEHYRPGGRLQQAGTPSPVRKKLIIRTTGRYTKAFMVFTALHMACCPEIRRACSHPLPLCIPKKHSCLIWPQRGNPSLTQHFLK